MIEPRCACDPRNYAVLYANDHRTVLGQWCPGCGSGLEDRSTHAAAEPSHGNGAVSGRRRPHKLEEPVQREIVAALEARGYRVFVTSRQHARCADCGSFRRTRGDGCTPGLADLIVTRDAWPRERNYLLEVKGPATARSREQSELERLGRIVVVRSVREALEAVNSEVSG